MIAGLATTRLQSQSGRYGRCVLQSPTSPWKSYRPHCRRSAAAVGGVAVASLFRQQRSRAYHELSYRETGDPASVLEYRHSHHSSSGDESSSDHDDVDEHDVNDDDALVHVDMLAAPWNPADVMSVRGTYPSPHKKQPSSSTLDYNNNKNSSWNLSRVFSHRTVAGSEGLGIVRRVPSTTSTTVLAKGDYVVPALSGLGTFRSTLCAPEAALIPVLRGKQLNDPVAAAPVFQTAGTALRLLEDFGDGDVLLQAGDTIVQNAGNSAVGVMVSQLAAHQGLRCISFVRRHERSERDYAAMVEHLQWHGSALVVADDDDDEKVRSFCRTHGYPKLALNAVGGTSARKLLSLCGRSSRSTFVTYGGMSQEPVSVPTSHLIFRDTRVVGYWHSRWMSQQSTAQQRFEMINTIADRILDGSIVCPPVSRFPFSDVREALDETRQQNQAIRRKVVFQCELP